MSGSVSVSVSASLKPGASPGPIMEMPMVMPMVEIDHLSLWYGAKLALKDISMSIPKHRVTAYIGPSGCGKSTLLRCLNRMNDLVDGVRVAGNIRIGGTDIHDPALDVTERRLREFGEAVVIEARVHTTDVLDPAVEVGHARQRLQGRAAPRSRPALPSRAVRTPGAGVRRLGPSRLAATEHPEQEEDRTTDQQELEESETTAEAAALASEQHGTQEPAQGETGDASHQAAEHARPLHGLLGRGGRRGRHRRGAGRTRRRGRRRV